MKLTVCGVQKSHLGISRESVRTMLEFPAAPGMVSSPHER